MRTSGISIVHLHIFKLYIVSDLLFYSKNMAKMRPFFLKLLDQLHIGHIFDSFGLDWLPYLNTLIDTLGKSRTKRRNG